MTLYVYSRANMAGPKNAVRVGNAATAFSALTEEESVRDWERTWADSAHAPLRRRDLIVRQVCEVLLVGCCTIFVSSQTRNKNPCLISHAS
jgi:hypothetical protein